MLESLPKLDPPYFERAPNFQFFNTKEPKESGYKIVNKRAKSLRLFFCFEWQFSAMNILIFFLMAVLGREQISFAFAFISLFFLFSIHNKNVLLCFENKNKMNLLPVQ